MARKRFLKPATVLKKWDAISEKDRNSAVARKYANMAGMKSMSEVKCAADMDKRGIPYRYEHETLWYQHNPSKYTPDFTLIDNDDMLIEVKGKMTKETRKKLQSIKRCNPERRVCLVFERPNNKLSSRPRSLRYWQWAERNGFEWSEQYVKDEWFND